MIPRRSAFLCLVSLLALAAIQSGALAQDWCVSGTHAAFIDMDVEADGVFPAPCDIVVSGVYARVFVRINSIPFQKVRLTIPDVAGVNVVNESWGVSFTGNHATGVELDMGACTGPGLVTVGYVDVVWEQPAECTMWYVANGARVQDCNGLWRPAYSLQHDLAVTYGCSRCLWQLCYGPLAPYDMSPPDGALDVPLDGVLAWTYAFEPAGVSEAYVRISTSPDCGSGQSYYIPMLASRTSFAPDFLAPNTTYYWQPRWGNYYDGACQDTGGLGIGPTYSFTTTGPNSVHTTTWGYVKSLYRE